MTARRAQPRAPHRRPAGMALIAVLWIVAALSILVIGLSGTVRQQIQIAGAQRDQVSGQAAAEAAMALALQALAVSSQRAPGIVTVQMPYAGQQIEVDIAPLNGLISLNGAGAPLLAALLQVAGGLDAGRAQALAANLVAWRDGRPEVDPTAAGAAFVQARRFEAPEDLLLVPGVDYALYARIAPLVTADLTGGGQVNPLAAPPAVLAVLAQGNLGQVQAYVRQRAAGQPGADASGFQGGFVGGGGTDLYRLQARVPLEAGKMLHLTRDVALGAVYARTAPWRILRTERQIVTRSAA